LGNIHKTPNRAQSLFFIAFNKITIKGENNGY